MSGIEFETKDVLNAVGGAAGAVCVWLWRQIKSRATRKELTGVVQMMEKNFEKLVERFEAAERHGNESRTEIYNAMRQSFERQSDTNVEVATALGELRGAMLGRSNTTQRGS